jgi:hypothetical protein
VRFRTWLSCRVDELGVCIVVSKQSIIVGVVLLVFAGICFLISGRSAGPLQSSVASKFESSQKSQSSTGPSEIQASAGAENTAAGNKRDGAMPNGMGPIAGSTATHPQKIDDKNPPEAQHFGSVAPVPGNATPQAASVMQALKSKTLPERLSAMFEPKAFNKAEFDANPKAYLDVTEPGRVFQTAQPGDRGAGAAGGG